MSRPDPVEAQRGRYNLEADSYDAHHNDFWSQRYRTEKIRTTLFDSRLEGLRVLEAMCASGTDTPYLISRGAEVTGLDISERNVELFRSRWDRPCVAASVHQMPFQDQYFDVVHVSGGLHHVLPLLPQAVREIYRVLRPGGLFTFVEPNADTGLDKLRSYWYRNDSRFTQEERALSYPRDLAMFLELGFSQSKLFSGGSTGYLVACQSHVLGLSPGFKRMLVPPALVVEAALGLLPFAPRLWFAGAWIRT